MTHQKVHVATQSITTSLSASSRFRWTVVTPIRYQSSRLSGGRKKSDLSRRSERPRRECRSAAGWHPRKKSAIDLPPRPPGQLPVYAGLQSALPFRCFPQRVYNLGDSTSSNIFSAFPSFSSSDSTINRIFVSMVTDVIIFGISYFIVAMLIGIESLFGGVGRNRLVS